MTPDDFLDFELIDLGDGFPPMEGASLKREMIEALRRGPLEQAGDLTVAIALAQLVHNELEAYGTDGGERFSDADAQLALQGLRSCLRRLDIEFDLPWRNLTTFRSFWIRRGCSNSWQARRDLLEEHFEPLHKRLFALEEDTLEAELAEAVSPRGATGWAAVDAEVRALRRRFRQAVSPQDYRAVGTHCIGVLEALSRTVYDPAVHLREGEVEPPADQTKRRLGRYVEVALAGKDHEALRGLATKAIALAQETKHRTTPTRREAGIAADTVILLANIFRRLSEPG